MVPISSSQSTGAATRESWPSSSSHEIQSRMSLTTRRWLSRFICSPFGFHAVFDRRPYAEPVAIANPVSARQADRFAVRCGAGGAVPRVLSSAQLGRSREMLFDRELLQRRKPAAVIAAGFRLSGIARSGDLGGKGGGPFDPSKDAAS